MRVCIEISSGYADRYNLWSTEIDDCLFTRSVSGGENSTGDCGAGRASRNLAASANHSPQLLELEGVLITRDVNPLAALLSQSTLS